MTSLAIALGILVVVFLAGNAVLAARERRLIRQRGRQGSGDFAAQFSTSAVPEEVLLAVHNYLGGRVFAKDFPVSATDRLDGVYGLDQEELGYDLPKLLVACQRMWPEEMMGENDLDRLSSSTVKEFVEFLASLPQSDSRE